MILGLTLRVGPVRALRHAAATGLLALTACTASEAVPTGPPVAVDRALEILGPKPLFATLDDSDRHIAAGAVNGNYVGLTIDQSLPAVRIHNGVDELRLGKSTDTPLFASPYFSWSWKFSEHRGKAHPVSVLVGFRGGTPGGDADDTVAGGLPAHDRLLALSWGASALQRGSFLPGTGPLKTSRYIIRGGSERVGQWWREGLDLIELYRRAWPDDKIVDVRIVFTGVATVGGPESGHALISGLSLSR